MGQCPGFSIINKTRWPVTQEHERIVKNAKLRAVRAKARIWRVSGTPASRLGFVMTTEMGFSPDDNGKKALAFVKNMIL